MKEGEWRQQKKSFGEGSFSPFPCMILSLEGFLLWDQMCLYVTAVHTRLVSEVLEHQHHDMVNPCESWIRFLFSFTYISGWTNLVWTLSDLSLAVQCFLVAVWKRTKTYRCIIIFVTFSHTNGILVEGLYKLAVGLEAVLVGSLLLWALVFCNFKQWFIMWIISNSNGEDCLLRKILSLIYFCSAYLKQNTWKSLF